MTVKVSVATTTYNHEPFIAQAIESVLQQETDFEYEHVIGEDCSTDRTREIAMDYKRQHPRRVRVLWNETNLGGRRNMVQVLQACRGEYIALLEGDDYWTSPYKLQKQVDFLDDHPECAICFHGVTKEYEAQALRPKREAQKAFKESYKLEDLLEANFIPTCSTMCRNGLFGDFPQWFFETPTGDWPYHVLNAHHGDIGYIDETMAVHRVHQASVWSPRNLADRRRAMIRTVEIFRRSLDPTYDRLLEDSLVHWHFKLWNALRLEGDYRGIASDLSDVLRRRDVCKRTILRAVVWAAHSKLNNMTRRAERPPDRCGGV